MINVHVSVSGRLDLVDLCTASFRIRDAVGNDVHLERVQDAAEAAQFVGALVTATGEAVLVARGQVAGLLEARVEPTSQPDWTAPSLRDVDFRAAAPPAPAGIDGVDGDEVAAFLALLRR